MCSPALFAEQVIQSALTGLVCKDSAASFGQTSSKRYMGFSVWQQNPRTVAGCE